MAIAHLASPQLLLLDEPAGCLDEDGGRLLGRLIEETVGRGGCVVEAAATGLPRGTLLALGGEAGVA